MDRTPFFVSMLAIAGAPLFLGCSALINPDQGRLGDAPDASATVDAGPGGFDAGPLSFDAGPVALDAGPPVGCEPSPPTCRGDSVVTCADGVEVTRDCQLEGSYCLEGGCREWNCTPGTRACNPGLASAVVCDARGIMQQEIACTGGACDPATGACTDIEPGMCDELPEMEVGDPERVDLCERSDENTYRAGGDCDGRSVADSGDQIYALRIERRGNYRIELEDEAILEDVDTVVYLRRQCDEPRSQIACGDDTACEGGGFPFPDGCMDGTRLGLSRIEIFLEPGTYYVVADAFVYDRGMGRSSECGTVELRVTSID